MLEKKLILVRAARVETETFNETSLFAAFIKYD